MAASFSPTGTDQIQPLVNMRQAFANVAALPDATKYANHIVILNSSTVPGGGPCLALSDGTSWWSIAVATTAIS